MDLATAFLTGFIGSLHCVGMCGPLALALPIGAGSTGTFIAGRSLYNVGRIVTYAAMGLVAGAVGRGVALSGFQQATSVIVGLSLVGAYLFPALFGRTLARLSFLEAVSGNVRGWFGELLRSRSTLAMFLVGVVNGLLPCGLVYVALAGSAMTGDPLRGALVAAVFGAGTFPMMFVVSAARKRVSVSFRQRLARIVPVFMVLLGILFILRGLNLGIPMVSPNVSSGMHSSGPPGHH